MKKVPCEIYTRVVGYFRPVRNWNEGKSAEFDDRKEFDEMISLDSLRKTNDFLTEKKNNFFKETDADVILFGTEKCDGCIKLKNSLLKDSSIKFKYVDVFKENKKEAQIIGVNVLPCVLLKNGILMQEPSLDNLKTLMK
jgi:ribonucleoside-triphosphate reductase